jgi:hypothetical protein
MALEEARGSTLLARLKPQHRRTSILCLSRSIMQSPHLSLTSGVSTLGQATIGRLGTCRERRCEITRTIFKAALDAREGPRPPIEAAPPPFMTDGLQIQWLQSTFGGSMFVRNAPPTGAVITLMSCAAWSVWFITT